MAEETYQLFKYDSCPFCYRVRQYLVQNGIEIPVRDIHTERAALADLVACGGRRSVPCLRIERKDDVEWMYESLDIMLYLKEKYGL
ncbi:MAG: glutathione S-transferase N-terminal domain-containing protein [Proteobacteria bacterium]|nr:glutathione S-transferase N-terminal domain-containing protein [Pseudomonadota bacterium]